MKDMKKILIVDDSPFFRGLLKEGLLKEAAMMPEMTLNVIEADDTLSSMARIKDSNPDLIFLDIVMRNSEQEGVAILQQIHKLYPAQKVIMMTSVGQTSVINKCRELGALDYLEKPFDRDQLLMVLKKHLDN